MESPTFDSCEQLERYLMKRGVRGVDRWPKPVWRLWENHRDGEVEFVELGKVTGFKVKKVRLRILASRPEGLRFLQERQIFTSGKRPDPSLSTSVSEKRQFLRGETRLECIRRALWEELKLRTDGPLVNLHELKRRGATKFRPSSSHPSLQVLATPEPYLWFMPHEHQQDSYQEVCAYRCSSFNWILPSERVLKELADMGLAKAA